MSDVKEITLKKYNAKLNKVKKQFGFTDGALEEKVPINDLISYLDTLSPSIRKATIYSLKYFASKDGSSDQYIKSLGNLGLESQTLIPKKEDKGETKETLQEQLDKYQFLYNHFLEKFKKTKEQDDFLITLTLYPLMDDSMPACRNDWGSIIVGEQPEGNYFDPKTRMVILRIHKSDKNGKIVSFKVPVKLANIIKTYIRHHKLKSGDRLLPLTKTQIYNRLNYLGISIREVRNFQVKYYEGEKYREITKRIKPLEESAKKRGHTTDVARRFYAV